MEHQVTPGETPPGSGDRHRFKWSGFLRAGEYEFEGTSSSGKRAGRTVVWIALAVVLVAAVVTVPLVFHFGGSQGGNTGASSQGGNPGAISTPALTGAAGGGSGSQGAQANPPQNQDSSSPSPSASPIYSVERESNLRLNQPDTPLYVDFDAHGWARAISGEAFEALPEEEQAKLDLSYIDASNGDLRAMNERQFGVLKPNVGATMESCMDATGSAPWTSARMDALGNAKETGLVAGATLCAVTEEGRVVAAKVVKVYAPGYSAPYIDFSVKVWKPSAA